MGLILRVVLGRARATAMRLRGVEIGERTRLGKGVRLDRPGTTRIGAHVEMEGSVWIKVVSDSAHVLIGDFTFLGRGVEVDVNDSVTIGSHVLIAPGAFITDHAHNIAAGKLIDSQGLSSAAVVIEDDVWIGAHAIVLPGVRMGRGSVAGAGAVVTRDVPENAVVGGVPARVLRLRE